MLTTNQIDTITAPTGEPTVPWTDEQVEKFTEALRQIYVMEQQVLFGSFAVQDTLNLKGVEAAMQLMKDGQAERERFIEETTQKLKDGPHPKVVEYLRRLGVSTK